MNEYTDEQLLHIGFDYALKYAREVHYKDDLYSLLFRDGFEEPIDESILSPITLVLAKRIGYELKDGMWEKDVKQD